MSDRPEPHRARREAAPALGAANPLPRALGLRDVTLLLVVAVVGLRWIPAAAAVGPSALAIWGIAGLAFFVPLAVTVFDLASRHPEEGGVYVWTRRAFGDLPAFLAAWMYWCSNLVYFPGLLYFAAASALPLAGDAGPALSSSPTYFVVASLVGLAIAFGLNLVGLRLSRWLHNLGAVATWIPVTVLVVAAALALMRWGSASTFDATTLAPSTRFQDFAFWSTIAFAFAGLETASFMGGEIVDARRTVPRAIAISGVLITLVYVLGTLAILILLPQSEVSGLQGIVSAVERAGQRLGLPGIATATSALVTFGSLAMVSVWFASTARLPYVAGVDRFLPPAFARTHPRWGTPVLALGVQAAGAALFTCFSQAGSSVKAAYDTLNSMTVLVYFVPYLFMFAAAIRLQNSRAGGHTARRLAVGGCAALGFAATLASILFAVAPPRDSADPARSVLKVVGAGLVLCAVGIVIYARGRRRAARSFTG